MFRPAERGNEDKSPQDGVEHTTVELTIRHSPPYPYATTASIQNNLYYYLKNNNIKKLTFHCLLLYNGPSPERNVSFTAAISAPRLYM